MHPLRRTSATLSRRAVRRTSAHRPARRAARLVVLLLLMVAAGAVFVAPAFAAGSISGVVLDDGAQPLVAIDVNVIRSVDGGSTYGPCGMGTLAAVSCGLADNLIERAADVMMKERRPLVLVPRETPLSAIHLENMLRLAHAGAVILPANPGFYHHPARIEDLVDFVVGRVLDQLRVPHQLTPRWGATAPPRGE